MIEDVHCARCGGRTHAGVRATYREEGELRNVTIATRYCPRCKKTSAEVALELQLDELREKHAAAAKRIAQLVDTKPVANDRARVANGKRSRRAAVANSGTDVGGARVANKVPPPPKKLSRELAQRVLEERARRRAQGLDAGVRALAAVFSETSKSAIARLLQDPARYGLIGFVIEKQERAA